MYKFHALLYHLKKWSLLLLVFSFGRVYSQNHRDSLDQEPLIKNLTVEEFNKRIHSGLVLVYLKADWCAICKKQTPIINELVAEQNNKLKLLIIDTEANPLINDYFEVPGLPLMYIYKDGKHVWDRIGLTEKKLILDQLNYFTK
ncbi:thioredoxin family protein [Aurantibacillus circumpalustris]|uniref:thioredoxin family protein n=1 Tax=Aurantibacillus circumpalustris TaxID=3036359 RepID=UPI00295A707D|nr:thioredoxin family protein [Aurantibacillus circumpalustris]